jgi:hypothetical protein
MVGPLFEPLRLADLARDSSLPPPTIIGYTQRKQQSLLRISSGHPAGRNYAAIQDGRG